MPYETDNQRMERLDKEACAQFRAGHIGRKGNTRRILAEGLEKDRAEAKRAQLRSEEPDGA